jgi:hypothetical protein
VVLGGPLCGGDGGDRTRVRQYSAIGSTCLVPSINLTLNDPKGRV